MHAPGGEFDLRNSIACAVHMLVMYKDYLALREAIQSYNKIKSYHHSSSSISSTSNVFAGNARKGRTLLIIIS